MSPALVATYAGSVARGMHARADDTLATCFDSRLVATGRQRYLIHCHKLEHEDAGTMSAFRVT
jgi:FtsP/CotA-like multicopper oxidase with cupredoxin domain